MVTPTTGMKSSKRFSLKRLSKKVLSHLRRPSNEKAININADEAPSTESSEPRSGDNSESEIASQPESTTLTDEQDTGGQREELETEKDTSAVENQTDEKEEIQMVEVNLVSPGLTSTPDDRKDLPTPLEKKSVEEEHQEGEVNVASADTSTAGAAEDQPIQQDESPEGEVSRALSGLSSKRRDEAAASIAKSTSEVDQGSLAQSSVKAGITASDPSDIPATTGSVASRCPTTTGSTHSQVQTKASWELIATSPIPSKVEDNDDVNRIISEVVGSEDSSSDHDIESQANDEEATKTSAADDKDDAFGADNDIALASSKLSMRSAISKLSRASKKSIKSLVSVAHSTKVTSASATRSLKSTTSTKSKSKVALKSTKSDAESVATVPKLCIDSKCSLSMLTMDPSADESTNSTKSKSKAAIKSTKSDAESVATKSKSKAAIKSTKSDAESVATVPKPALDSKCSLSKSTKSDEKSVATVPKPALDSKCSLSMLLSDPSSDEACDDCGSTTSATYFVHEHNGEVEIEAIINDDSFSFPTVSLYSFQAENCDYTPGELLPL